MSLCDQLHYFAQRLAMGLFLYWKKNNNASCKLAIENKVGQPIIRAMHVNMFLFFEKESNNINNQILQTREIKEAQNSFHPN